MRLRVKPASAGLIVRDPHTRQPLPEEGAEVLDSSYWRRRIAGGDVVLLADKPAAKPTDKKRGEL